MAIRPEIWRGRRCLMGAIDGDAAFISIIPDDLVNEKRRYVRNVPQLEDEIEGALLLQA
jgi:hypothetical protein